MKPVKARPITDLLRDYIREGGLESPLLEYRLIHQGWPAVVGDYAAACTEDLKIYNQVLYARMSSSVVRQELHMQRTELTRRLNAFVDAFVITDIRFS
ncbi:MAG: DUF721 domain-containing protein [Bacteroidaceae bacterium]|nr:DUF721 domain-containing protein [Bacteroidaceae bacterium]